MRIDVVSIFPDYLAPLELSLPGKARRQGAARHTRPRPAGLDPRPAPHRRRHAVRRRRRHGDEARAVGRGARRAASTGRRRPSCSPTPSGEPFTQAVAARAGRPREHLVFACGRYEGIDQRVLDHAADPAPRSARSRSATTCSTGERWPRSRSPRPSSGCSPASWATPSRWPRSRTRTGCWSTPSTPSPPSWRGHDVPPVLLSGDHARIAAWRHDQAVRRTAERRPDLLHPAGAVSATSRIRLARPGRRRRDATLQLACWVAGGSRPTPGVRDPGAARDARRRARLAGRVTPCSCAPAAGGWSGRRAAALRRRRAGTSAG